MRKVSVPESPDDPSRDWPEYRLTHNSQFLKRIEKARYDIRAGKGTRLESLSK